MNGPISNIYSNLQAEVLLSQWKGRSPQGQRPLGHKAPLVTHSHSTIQYLCLFMLPAALYTASILVICLVHEKEKTDLQCDMSFDAGITLLDNS